MLNKIIVSFGLIFVFFLSGCDNQKTELIITEHPAQEQSTINKKIEPATDTAKPRISIAPDDIVEILVREDGAPGMYLGSDGEVHGFYVDLEKMIMEEMGQAFHMRPYSDVGPVAQGLKSGIYHTALAAPDLPEYRSFLNLSIPYEILHYVTFVQNDNTSIKGKTREELIKSLHGKKVGVQTRGHIYLTLRDIREIELVEYPTTTKALADLNKGLLDAVPDVKRIGLHYTTLNDWKIKPVGMPIISHNLTTAFSQALDDSLLNRYNAALQSLLNDGRFDALCKGYFGQDVECSRP